MILRSSWTPGRTRTGERARAGLVVIGAFAANAAANAVARDAVRPPSPPLTPPDWVFLLVWPLLKTAAASADLHLTDLPVDRDRRILLGLRSGDWLLFSAFSAVSATGSPTAVVASTAAQTLLTAEAARRSWPVRRTAALLLVPQALWLTYATALCTYGALDRDRRGR